MWTVSDKTKRKQNKNSFNIVKRKMRVKVLQLTVHRQEISSINSSEIEQLNCTN